MVRATMCPSSGEITVSIRHIVLVILCGWPSGMQVGVKIKHAYQTVSHTHTQCDKYQVLYWYIYFFWWWAHSCPKHVENRNKHTKKELCTGLVLFTKLYKDARSTKLKIPHYLFVCTWGNQKSALAQSISYQLLSAFFHSTQISYSRNHQLFHSITSVSAPDDLTMSNLSHSSLTWLSESNPRDQ
jgi:hypothetical protein